MASNYDVHSPPCYFHIRKSHVINTFWSDHIWKSYCPFWCRILHKKRLVSIRPIFQMGIPLHFAYLLITIWRYCVLFWKVSRTSFVFFEYVLIKDWSWLCTRNSHIVHFRLLFYYVSFQCPMNCTYTGSCPNGGMHMFLLQNPKVIFVD